MQLKPNTDSAPSLPPCVLPTWLRAEREEHLAMVARCVCAYSATKADFTHFLELRLFIDEITDFCSCALSVDNDGPVKGAGFSVLGKRDFVITKEIVTGSESPPASRRDRGEAPTAASVIHGCGFGSGERVEASQLAQGHLVLLPCEPASLGLASTVPLLRHWLQSAQEPRPGLRRRDRTGGAGSCSPAGLLLAVFSLGAGAGRSPATPGLSAPSWTPSAAPAVSPRCRRGRPAVPLCCPEPSAPGRRPCRSLLGWGLLVFWVFVFTLWGFLIRFPRFPHLEQPLAAWRRAAPCHALPHRHWGSPGWVP